MSAVDPRQRTRLSKFLAFVLRHKPEAADLALDARGCAHLDDLAAAAIAELGIPVTRDDLIALAEQSEAGSGRKRRFEVEGDFMRAWHGHSIPVEAARRRSRDVVVLEVDVAKAQAAGVRFYASADPRIVLCDDLPPECLRLKE